MLSKRPQKMILLIGTANPVPGSGGKDGKYKYEIQETSPLFKALLNDKGPMVQVFIDHLMKLLGNGRVQPSVIRDMGAALRELHALGMAVSEDSGEALLIQAAGKGDVGAIKFLMKHLTIATTQKAFDNGSLLMQGVRNNEVEVLQLVLSTWTAIDLFVLVLH
ncbi:hypothetical protein SI65_07418 [Aspergillus cristatus]|uniref:Uncharacterized protein n=1 Tax=Aspergillus cristatus TaxID=573508 RepID=A0A1E3B7V8_ASPCR|nr:hypothetical protein SI65_07418 [Aspergillus cristatus]